MRAIAEDLWVAEQPLRFGLLQLGTRMTVVRLSDSSLLLHSPIALTESLRVEIEELGFRSLRGCAKSVPPPVCLRLDG